MIASEIGNCLGKVGIVPYELRHKKNLAAITLDQLIWPDQTADLNLDSAACISELGECDYVVVYPSSTRLLNRFRGVKCKVVLLMAEPLAIHRRYYRLIWLLRYKFAIIFCRYDYYASAYANVIQLAVAESWVKVDTHEIAIQKKYRCSIIASEKRELVGHKLRHEVIAWLKNEGHNVDALGRGYQPFDKKQEGLLPYTYSVVIENVQEPDYFTEKLLDCLLCGTLPIYFGPQNIGNYFNLQGIILCQSLADIQIAIATTVKPPTKAQIAAMAENRMIALSYSNLQKRIVDTIRSNAEISSPP